MTGLQPPARAPMAASQPVPELALTDDPDIAEVQHLVCTWFATHARDLPWRVQPTAWGVLVSEVMLQQTPVARVQPVWSSWMQRWPAPSDLAADSVAEAIRAWGRLGYPRRAMRLHAAATVITTEHAGNVPADYETLRTLPGVGDYTAAAVVSFAFRGRAVVLDVNVRRLFARYFAGLATAPGHVTAAERAMASALVPATPEAAATWAGATMELGQVLCTARNPACERCPLAVGCSWLAAGQPGAEQPTTRRQGYYGTDRYVRGLIMRRLRDGPTERDELDVLWNDPDQSARALDSLVADGLVDPYASDKFALPGDAPPAAG